MLDSVLAVINNFSVPCSLLSCSKSLVRLINIISYLFLRAGAYSTTWGLWDRAGKSISTAIAVLSTAEVLVEVARKLIVLRKEGLEERLFYPEVFRNSSGEFVRVNTSRGLDLALRVSHTELLKGGDISKTFRDCTSNLISGQISVLEGLKSGK